MDLGAAIMALFATTLIKIPVMIFTGWLLLKMGGATSGKPQKKLWILVPDQFRKIYKVLFYSLVFFAISEIFCGIETYILMRSHSLGRIAHSLASAIGMALFFVGAYELLQARSLHFLEKRCFMRGACGGCPVLDGEKCNFNPLLWIVTIAIMLMAVPPFFASTEAMTARPLDYLLPFETLNIWYDNSVIPFMKMLNPDYLPIGDAFYLYSAPQILNYRIYPIVVILLMAVSLLFFKSKDVKRIQTGVSIMLFGAGVLGFTYYELILYRMTDSLFIGAVGHEIGELFFLIFITEFLRRMFALHESTNQN